MIVSYNLFRKLVDEKTLRAKLEENWIEAIASMVLDPGKFIHLSILFPSEQILPRILKRMTSVFLKLLKGKL